VSATLVRSVLADAGIPPAPQRDRQSSRSFLRQQGASILACAVAAGALPADGPRRSRQPGVRFRVHDRDSEFSAAFDALFDSAGIRIIRTRPERARRALDRHCSPRVPRPALDPRPVPLTNLHRRELLGGLIHEYQLAA
jgi:hypothetical protein